ncbi:MAG: hypothetical protein UV62_C0026G0003 [Parcubacteria group bacterium GW2011_GWC1_43_11]|nr:MAG: hypothetical protein UV62_C0026G0003 [Parcubacteria group bacterium GW2011_GWC1_43_11]
MAKQKPYIIKGTDPTEEEMRKELGLSKREVGQVNKTVNKIIKKKRSKKTKK